ncbi:LysR family transcriptional regulator [Amycolatopsis sp. lyj-112]|uniref:LysR family transcriptional regulator n=1 Tax=Amycolatopsis sp. lyj-112 TaxID=2789288 RepID=UPI00397D9A82
MARWSAAVGHPIARRSAGVVHRTFSVVGEPDGSTRAEDAMEFRHLESFLALADELHFGRAAARLHLTQPSLSQQLQRLERGLGVELVARTSHEVRLTAAGHVFRRQARLIVAQLEKAAHSTREAAAGRAGTVNVGYNFPAGQHVLPAVLARMNAEYPGVTVALWERRTGPQLAALAEGELDVALVYGHPVSSRFRFRRLLRVPMVAVVGQGHEWAGRSAVSFAELAHHPCVLFAREQCPAMYDAILGAAEQSGITLNVSQVVDDPGATAIVVSVHPLVGFASETRGTSVGSVSGGVRPVPVRLTDPVPAVELYAVWRATEPSPLGETFLRCLDEVPSLPGPSDGPAEPPVRVT